MTNYIDWPVAIMGIGMFLMIVALYGINNAARAAMDKRRIDHEEFKAKLQPNHQEQLAKIEATRSSEIVKYTGKPVPVVQQIENR